MLHEQIVHRLWRGLEALKGVLCRRNVVQTRHAVELPQIDGQNAGELDRMCKPMFAQSNPLWRTWRVLLSGVEGV